MIDQKIYDRYARGNVNLAVLKVSVEVSTTFVRHNK